MNIGPKAQAVLAEFPTDDPADYFFSPASLTAERMAARSGARKTPRYPSHMKRNQAKKLANPKRAPGARYAVGAYTQAVAKGCKAGGVPGWCPNRLRHSFATEVRKTHGLEAAQVLLGHASADGTQIYAEKDSALARDVAAKIG